MNSYAQIKGNTVRPAVVANKATSTLTDELSDAEIERIAQNRDFVKEHIPEIVDLIKELHAAGMIDGWRSVRNCKLIESES